MPDAESPAAPIELGLRERTKQRRRDVIQRAALRLFTDQGYENTTVADIAAGADVAPRTVSGYFPSKLQLATAFADGIAERLTAAFAAAPDRDVLEVLDGWLRGETGDVDAELAALVIAMYEANPGLRALTSAQVAEAAEVGRSALRRSLGRAAEDPVVDVCMAAVGACLSAFLGAVFQGRPADPLHDEVMAMLRTLVASARRR